MTTEITITDCTGCDQPMAPDLQGEWIACPNEPTSCIDCYPCHGDDEHVFVATPACSICREASHIVMTSEQASAYAARTTPVQDLFPDMARDRREVLISGTHPTCWLAIYGTD